ncbi:MAG: glycosyltransferase family 2 protein [Methylococcaceae bacterium]|nr:glycosyltransferase family 2 protein [Methylococcaceae bacterium]
MNQKITVTIITYNEEAFIKACIQSAWRVADEVIVVDSLSTDKTQEIAETMGARVFICPFEGYGPQKEKAAQYATYDWILNIDADERLDEAMVNEIKQLDFNAPFDAYAFPRKNHIGLRWQKAWYPDYVIRLYNKQRCRFSPAKVHESLITKNYKKIKGDIIHYSFKDLSDCIVRADKYSKIDAKLMVEKGRKIKGWDPVFHAVTSFLKFFILKKGFAYGLDGLNASLLGALRSYLKYAHAIEMAQAVSASPQDNRPI